MKKLLGPYRYVIAYAAIASFVLDVLLLTSPIYMMQVFDRVMTSRSESTLIWLTLLAVLLLLVYLAIDWLRGRMMTSMSRVLDRVLSERVLRVVMEDAAAPRPGKHAFLMRDATTLRNFIGGPSFTAMLEAPWLPFFLLIIYLVHPVLGWIAIISSVALMVLAIVNNRISQKPLEELQKVGRHAGQYVELSLRNAEVVRGMGMFPGLVERWGRLNRDSLRLQFETGKVTALVMGINKFSRQFIQIIMLAAGVTLVLEFNATPGVIIAATFILGRAQMPLDQLISGWKSLVDAHAAYRRLDEGLARVERGERTRLPDIEGRVEVERVTFGVVPGAPPILKGIQFQIEAGEMLGLIGPSGSGKSTLVRLLTGVWPPVSGAVRIDGADVRHWEPEEIGPQLGYLPQDIELFPGTVAENIARMGEPDSEAVVAAAQLAGAHDMVLRLTNGYDTEIGASGAALSGGQRQRIGLARALYGKPRLVILDEPNAYLDAEGESILVQTFHRLREAKVTLIVVTHKPSLLAEADKLLVLHDGMVRAFGPRDEVMAKLGMAPRLVAATGRMAEEAAK
jgi:ATP-binding cassette subfamily C protein EexD